MLIALTVAASYENVLSFHCFDLKYEGKTIDSQWLVCALHSLLDICLSILLLSHVIIYQTGWSSNQLLVFTMANIIYKKKKCIITCDPWAICPAWFIIANAWTILLPTSKSSVRKKQHGTETRRNLQLLHGKVPCGSLGASLSVFYRHRSIVS